MRQDRRSPASGLFLGGLLVAAGLILFLQNTGLARAHDLWTYWPAILIAAGLAKIMESSRPSPIFAGISFAAAGLFLLLRNLDILVLDLRVVWPVLLIGLGVAMLVKTLDHPSQSIGK